MKCLTGGWAIFNCGRTQVNRRYHYTHIPSLNLMRSCLESICSWRVMFRTNCFGQISHLNFKFSVKKSLLASFIIAFFFSFIFCCASYNAIEELKFWTLTLWSLKKKFRQGTIAFQEAIFWAVFTENCYEIDLQFFLFDQVEKLNFRKKKFVF